MHRVGVSGDGCQKFSGKFLGIFREIPGIVDASGAFK